MERYYLHPWIHACRTSEGTVILNLKDDQYLGLAGRYSRVLHRLLAGENPLGDGDADIVRELLERDILTVEPTPPGRSPIRVPPPVSAQLVDDDPEYQHPRPGFGHIANLMYAYFSIVLILTFRSLEYAVSRTGRHRVRSATVPNDRELQRARGLVHVFRLLRPFLYESRDKCLLDSLVLHAFLKRYGIDSICVLGVKTLPFFAHCWVQIDRNLATDGTPAFITTFSPIFAF